MQSNQTIKLNTNKFRIVETRPVGNKFRKAVSISKKMNFLSKGRKFINNIIPDLDINNEFNRSIHSELDS